VELGIFFTGGLFTAPALDPVDGVLLCGTDFFVPIGVRTGVGLPVVLGVLVVDTVFLTTGLFTPFASAPAVVLGVTVFFVCGMGFFVPMGVRAGFGAVPVPDAAVLGVEEGTAFFTPLVEGVTGVFGAVVPTFFCAEPTVPWAFLTAGEAVFWAWVVAAVPCFLRPSDAPWTLFMLAINGSIFAPTQ
jgi:hypothetical protein